jgi:hypothetical protein
MEQTASAHVGLPRRRQLVERAPSSAESYRVQILRHFGDTDGLTGLTGRAPASLTVSTRTPKE